WLGRRKGLDGGVLSERFHFNRPVPSPIGINRYAAKDETIVFNGNQLAVIKALARINHISQLYRRCLNDSCIAARRPGDADHLYRAQKKCGGCFGSWNSRVHGRHLLSLVLSDSFLNRWGRDHDAGSLYNCARQLILLE